MPPPGTAPLRTGSTSPRLHLRARAARRGPVGSTCSATSRLEAMSQGAVGLKSWTQMPPAKGPTYPNNLLYRVCVLYK